MIALWLLLASLQAPAPVVAISPNRCTVTLRATPPDATGGWRVQFLRDADISVGTADSSAPYERTVSNIVAGDHVFFARWTKSGAATVTTATVATTECEAAPTCTPVDCVWGPWSAWVNVGACTTAGQEQVRTRAKTAESCGGAACTGLDRESQFIACTLPGAFTMSLSATSVPYGSTVPLTVTWANIPTPTTGDWLAIYSFDAPSHHFNIGDAKWKYVDCSQRFTGVLAVPSGSCTFDVSGLVAYRYRVSLNANEGLTEIARREFTVVDAPPPIKVVSEPSNEVTTTPDGSTLTVAWEPPLSGAPAGYVVMTGEVSGVYTHMTDVGLLTQATVDVPAGVTVYAVVVAYAYYSPTSAPRVP